MKYYRSIAFRICLGSIVLFLFFSFSYAGVNRKFYNEYQQIKVSGPSMLQTLQHGEVTLCYNVYPYKKLRRVDIVIIRSQRGFSVIHRIVRRYRGGLWITRGDNNDFDDRELLSSKNFTGLVLVDESSIKRYTEYIDSIGDKPSPDVLAYTKGHAKRRS